MISILKSGIKAPMQFVGLSTDTKPTSATNGSTFIEMDTGKIYFYNEDGQEWLEFGA